MQTSGLFQKIKGFFTPVSSARGAEIQPEKVQHPHNVSSAGMKPARKLPYNYENINVSAIDLSLHSNMSFTSRNPNDTLADFFNKKGDTPLNEIEVEGVLSLIKKSQHSRSPSRNTSVLLHQNQNSLFLNSNLDSKLGGLSSFNDINNSTILRPASNKLKNPVKIKTPTFVSKKKVNSKPDLSMGGKGNISANLSVNNSTLSSAGIRKRRIVSYTNLKSPYNLKASSPLTAFLEKKKQHDNSKAKADSKLKVTSRPENKSVYDGGVIDLSKMDDDNYDDEASVKSNSKSNTVAVPKKAGISKTATKVLDILNMETSSKTTAEKPAAIEPLVKNEIITVDDDDDDKDQDKQDQIETKESSKPNNTPKFSFSLKDGIKQHLEKSKEIPAETEIKSVAPAPLDVESVSKPFAFQNPIPVAPTKQITFNTTVGSTASTLTSQEKPFSLELKTSESIPTHNAVSASLESGTKSTSSSHEVKSSGNLENTQAAENDIEVIDSFIFPEVPSQEQEDFEDSTIAPPEIAETLFTFPSVEIATQETLKLAEKIPAGEYSDVFIF